MVERVLNTPLIPTEGYLQPSRVSTIKRLKAVNYSSKKAPV